MGRQQRWCGRGLAAVVMLAVAGCTAVDDTAFDGAQDVKPSASGSGAGGGQAADNTTLPGVPGVEQAREELAGLAVAAHGSMSGYSRAKFPHWAEKDGCDTRERVLERDGTGVERDGECRAVSGAWVSVYDDETFTDAGDVDIDHTVPLANAWRSGAAAWTQDKRREFANDMDHPQLLAVSASSNRSKGDQGPDEWQPPSKTYWCIYARSWVSVKAAYGLSVTGAEKNTLTDMLDTCS
ncbi:HNH endonuclease family protein [Streptomyces europaeiscabiei]|uniref:HNH endonuclease family protein n=1 Tax=Streptomyces europaeiscabiei TaxID=146819 RepID=UPI002E16C0D8